MTFSHAAAAFLKVLRQQAQPSPALKPPISKTTKRK
jgi:hypothetical protein